MVLTAKVKPERHLEGANNKNSHSNKGCRKGRGGGHQCGSCEASK